MEHDVHSLIYALTLSFAVCVTEYLQDVAEILLFLLLPEADFHCKPLRLLVRELFVEVIILPLIDLFSDPDYINQTLIWLVSQYSMPFLY